MQNSYSSTSIPSDDKRVKSHPKLMSVSTLETCRASLPCLPPRLESSAKLILPSVYIFASIRPYALPASNIPEICLNYGSKSFATCMFFAMSASMFFSIVLEVILIIREFMGASISEISVSSSSAS
jgi:hypothetical protein